MVLPMNLGTLWTQSSNEGDQDEVPFGCVIYACSVVSIRFVLMRHFPFVIVIRRQLVYASQSLLIAASISAR